MVRESTKELAKAAQDCAQMARSVSDMTKQGDIRELALAVFRLARAIEDQIARSGINSPEIEKQMISQET